MAPIIPFVTDHIYQNTVRELEKNAKISVHLSEFAKVIDMPKYPKVLEETEIAREVITTCQRMRNEVQIKIKQPLSKLYIVTSKEKQENLLPLMNIVKEELNIKECVFVENEDAFNENYFTVNFRNAGAALKGEAQKLKPLVDSLEGDSLAKFHSEYKTGKISIGQFADLDKSLFDIHDRPKDGFTVAKENDFTLALNTVLDKDLKREGFIRETIRQIQVLRKEAGFAVEQRIVVSFTGVSDEVATAIAEYEDRIKQDILAISIEENIDTDIAKEIEINEETFTVKLKLA
jgi:isoleucyl-tRNA synthetase